MYVCHMYCFTINLKHRSSPKTGQLYVFSFMPSRTVIDSATNDETVENLDKTDIFIKKQQTVEDLKDVKSFSKPKNFKDTKYEDLKIDYRMLRSSEYELMKAYYLKAKEKKEANSELERLEEIMPRANPETFKKEFHQELKKKLKGLGIEVIGKYESEIAERNSYSKCETSEIDIILKRPKTTTGQKGEVEYTPGAVIELKTTPPGDNEWTAAHSQTAYKMLKLGTDMAIEDKLKKGEPVDVVIVYGILVYMDTQTGVVMELRLDFTRPPPEPEPQPPSPGPSPRPSPQPLPSPEPLFPIPSPFPKCIRVDDRGIIPLKDTFQLVVGKLIQ